MISSHLNSSFFHLLSVCTSSSELHLQFKHLRLRFSFKHYSQFYLFIMSNSCSKIMNLNSNMMFFASQVNKLSVLNILNYNYHQTHLFNETINTKFKLIIRILLYHFNVMNLFLYIQRKINVARNILIASKK